MQFKCPNSKITIVATMTILLICSVMLWSCSDKSGKTEQQEPPHQTKNSPNSTNGQKSNTNKADTWQALGFYHRSWIYFHSLYIDHQGNAALAVGEGTNVTKYAHGKLTENALASIRQSLKDSNIPGLKPSYLAVKDDNLVRELDQFDLRLFCSNKVYRVTGELNAAPASLQKFYQQLLTLVKDQTTAQDELTNMFLRVVALGRGEKGKEEVEKWIKKIRQEGVIVPTIDAKKLKELPCLCRAIEREGLIVPCKNTELLQKYLTGTGEAEIEGNYYTVEFFTKAPQVKQKDTMGHKSNSNQ